MDLSTWSWLIGVLLIAAAAWWLGHARLTLSRRPRDYSVGGARAEPSAPDVALSPRDRVQASALVPKAVARGQVFRVEAVLARPRDMAHALAALNADPQALESVPPRGLAALLRRESVLEVTLDCADAASIAPRSRRLVWTGAPLTAGFQVRPRADLEGDRLLADVNVFVNRVCVGYLPLSLPVQAAGDGTPARAEAAFEVPRRVFMSYTGSDRDHVLPIARALRSIGIDAFMDRLSLEAGEEWEERLYAEIDACDCFMLFWSPAAARSPWVEREAVRALNLRRASATRRPKIVTHLLGKPPPAAVPPSLAALHFNDPAYALWEAAVAQLAS
jgi:hypothetical protein